MNLLMQDILDENNQFKTDFLMLMNNIGELSNINLKYVPFKIKEEELRLGKEFGNREFNLPLSVDIKKIIRKESQIHIRESNIRLGMIFQNYNENMKNTIIRVEISTPYEIQFISLSNEHLVNFFGNAKVKYSVKEGSNKGYYEESVEQIIERLSYDDFISISRIEL